MDKYPLPPNRCACGLRIYQFNSLCVGCGRAIGNCGKCHKLTSFELRDNEYYCDQSDCKALVQQCFNRVQNAVCNSMTPKEETTEPNALCEFCVLTVVIPSLDNPRNLLRWQRLESAKRQLHSQLRALGLPPYKLDKSIKSVPPLSYEFVESNANACSSPITMGHTSGTITIIAEEADAGYREGLREQLGEPQRTLVRHFRHEIGHYIDFVGVPENRRAEYNELFGDPSASDYDVAMQNYYQNPDATAWQMKYVSKYATMHPWEDFAETVDAFLDMAAVVQVANDHETLQVQSSRELATKKIIDQYLEIALLSNELNFSRGLEMLIPEIISEDVRKKLQFVSTLCCN